jgi:hypothetical protein
MEGVEKPCGFSESSNLSLSGTFKGWKNEPKIRVGIENMMNTTYRDYLNRQRYFADALGRNITLGWLQYF